MTHTHGGARPATREDDGRRNNRPTVHPGRRPSTFTLKIGDVFFFATKDADGNGIGLGEVCTVTEITRTHVVLSSDTGDRHRLIR